MLAVERCKTNRNPKREVMKEYYDDMFATRTRKEKKNRKNDRYEDDGPRPKIKTVRNRHEVKRQIWDKVYADDED